MRQANPSFIGRIKQDVMFLKNQKKVRLRRKSLKHTLQASLQKEFKYKWMQGLQFQRRPPMQEAAVVDVVVLHCERVI
ncbi:unnamed protein product [Lactuca virosa]|uniref:Uncharacterized protein n=1 Tax=Lactuca virosa TaxID=75947 RepID=A0AAU9N580_9ASTR|nr:unnamed protein product [Lactuca virosa]